MLDDATFTVPIVLKIIIGRTCMVQKVYAESCNG